MFENERLSSIPIFIITAIGIYAKKEYETTPVSFVSKCRTSLPFSFIAARSSAYSAFVLQLGVFLSIIACVASDHFTCLPLAIL